MGAGDVLAQLAVERCPLHKYDPVRSSRYLILGTLGLVSKNVNILNSPVVSGGNFCSKKRNLALKTYLLYFYRPRTYYEGR